MAPYKSKPVTVKITVDGKPYWVRGKTKKEAREKAAIKKAQLEAGARTVNKDMFVSDWCEFWRVTYKKGSLNDRNYADLKTIIDKYISPVIGNRKVKNVRPAEVQKILNDLIETKSTAYIRRIYQTLSQIFREAYNNDLILTDITKGLKCPQGKAPVPRRPITDRERELTLQVAETNRGGLFVLIMLYAGLRPGEVAALRWNNIDMKAKIIHVSQAVKASDELGAPKSSAGVRDVPIPPYLYDKLSAVEHGPFDLVCTNTKGGRLSKSTIRRMWEGFVKDLNIAAGCKTDKYGNVLPPYFVTDLVLYDYRHTYGTDLQAAGVPINVARELMGHEDISTTAHIYTHKSEAAFNDAADKIAAYSSKK